jgi:hypothetical protein
VNTIEDFLHASKVIRENGLDGIKIASRLVGEGIALGMLIMFLHDRLNEGGGYPDNPQTEEKIRDALEKEGLLPTGE